MLESICSFTSKVNLTRNADDYAGKKDITLICNTSKSETSTYKSRNMTKDCPIFFLCKRWKGDFSCKLTNLDWKEGRKGGGLTDFSTNSDDKPRCQNYRPTIVFRTWTNIKEANTKELSIICDTQQQNSAHPKSSPVDCNWVQLNPWQTLCMYDSMIYIIIKSKLCC